MIRPGLFQSTSVRPASTPLTAAPASSRTPRAAPPTMVRPGRAGSTSRPPGAPETNAVTSRRRLNACASTRSRLVAIARLLRSARDGGVETGGQHQGGQEREQGDRLGDVAEAPTAYGAGRREQGQGKQDGAGHRERDRGCRPP